MITISSNFIGYFKLGDNICYNLECIRLLKNTHNSDKAANRSLIKPLVIFIASVAEAVLYDFYNRLHSHPTGRHNLQRKSGLVLS